MLSQAIYHENFISVTAAVKRKGTSALTKSKLNSTQRPLWLLVAKESDGALNGERGGISKEHLPYVVWLPLLLLLHVE